MKKKFHPAIHAISFIYRFILSNFSEGGSLSLRNVKFLFLIIGTVGFSPISNAQPGTWTWMKGDSTSYGVPIYGTQGVPDPANTPAAMRDPAAWTDLAGNLWLFGGSRDGASEYNTLWNYNILTNEWTWIRGDTSCCSNGLYGSQGVPDANNTPGARYTSCTWVDLNGDLWLYGGMGYDNTGGYVVFNDLWKYHIETNEWTWMDGYATDTHDPVYGTIGLPDDANNPGSRAESHAAWTDDSGNLWMFGGAIYAGCGPGCFSITGVGNDLWNYNLTTNQWTWMKGSNLLNQPGTYGIQGVPDTLNTPGGRSTYAQWKNNDTLWLFGGSDVFGNSFWNDTWKYDIVNNTWTWMAGSNGVNDLGIYGTKCFAGENYEPGSRTKYVTWSDSLGSFYLWGGLDNNNGIRNDLWHYAASTNKWIWAHGDSVVDQPGNYGIKGVASPANIPPGKFGDVSWLDHQGNLWLFGGPSVNFETKNDLWKYVQDTSCISGVATIVEYSPVPSFEFSLYPNPASGRVTIEFPVTRQLDKSVKIIVTNSLGQQVFSSEEEKSSSQFPEGVQTIKKEIDLSNANEGLYIIEVKTSDQTLEKKVMIIH